MERGELHKGFPKQPEEIEDQPPRSIGDITNKLLRRLQAASENDHGYPDDGGITRLYGEQAGRYVIYGDGGRAPTKVHPSRIRAHKEMQRLAKKNPGTTFVMCKIKEAVIFQPDFEPHPAEETIDG